MNKILALIALLLLQNFYSQAQSFAINTTGTAAHASAMLDVTSTIKGLLIPRLTTAQRTAIASPGKGLFVYDSTLKSFYFHDGVNWQPIVNDSNNLWRKNGNNIYNYNTGNVGIGTSTAQSLLHVKGGAVLFDSTIGGTPVSGAGTRMMWIPAKGAFRAGRVDGAYSANWDNDSIGIYSFSVGYETKALGTSSISIGQFVEANDYATLAMGMGSRASASDAIAIGISNKATGTGSIAIGSSNTASNEYSVAIGIAVNAYGARSSGVGYGLFSKSYGGFATGQYNDSTDAASAFSPASLNRIFQIGNGTANNFRSNAMTVLQNGNVGIGTTTPPYMLTVKNDINVDNSSSNNGTFQNSLQFGSAGTGETIASNRNTVVNQWGLDFYTAFNNRMCISNGGNVGIGTTSPTSKLDVNGQITIDQKNFGGYGGLLIKGNTAVSNYPNIGFSTQNTSASDVISAAIGGNITNNTAGSEAIDLGFYTSTSGQSGLAQRMVIKDNGNVGIGETSPTVPLNFASTLGDKIALWGNGSNHYGLGIQPSLLQVYTLDASNDIAFGYGSSGSFTENVRMKGNGTTVTKGLQVSNGTVFTKMQSGSATVGSCATAQKSITIFFPVAFASGTPKVFATARNEPASSFNDAFSVSVRSISSTSVTLNVQRTDSITGWGQQLLVDWFAVE
ncbi:MAG: hypothetical protein NTX08_08845 [Sphingobacteriales bacterium]|nr:hypothetical protein [Sphingobacteriales bacterium]